MRLETLTESRAGVLSLTRAQADAISRAGQELASDRSWWGAGSEEETDRTIIQCSHLERDLWRVTTRDAIGIVVVGDTLQIRVDPKIPFDHFVYLAQLSGVVPRIDEGKGSGIAATSFWELVATWFVIASERLIRGELLRDYALTTEEIGAHRGTLLPLETAAAFYAGRPVLTCEFDDFSFDTPLNRLIKAAANAVAMNELLWSSLRRRARRIVVRMEETSNLLPGDERAGIDRRTRHYSDAVVLAKHILRNTGRSFETGAEPVWTFLIRTPEIIEQGVRCLLQRRFGSQMIRRRRLRLAGSNLTLNPDLVVEDESDIVIEDNGDTIATGDVKYKISSGDWKREDLYQAITFATGFTVDQAAICEFRPPNVKRLRPIMVGDVRLSHIGWTSDAALAPDDAATGFLDEFAIWLREFVPVSGDIAPPPRAA